MTTNPSIDRTGMSRRRILGAALAAGVAVPIGIARPAWAAPALPGPARLTLPPPTGPYPLGTMSLHLVDKSDPDPVAGPGHYRELMASVWYPARNVSRYPLAQWMLPAPLRGLLISGEFDPDVAVTPLTAGHEGAPVLCTGEGWPVIVFSHGAHDHRSDTTIVVQELASHGYVVVTVDHTNDAFSEFPDGRLTVPLYDYPMYPGDFARDIRFVVDQIEVLAAGGNPDAEHRPLPAGLGAALDLHRVGMFGWSKGATATALVMGDDPRVRAGLSFDGPMESDPPVPAELDRPFMLMTAVFTRAAEPNVAEFWSHLTGWPLNVQAEGAIHSSYCDVQWLLPQLAKAIGMSDEELQGWIGTLDPVRAVRIQQAYPLAFFDQHLRGRRGHLLDGPSLAFPEVTFIP
jgi:predicted dienelactone hydrolase